MNQLAVDASTLPQARLRPWQWPARARVIVGLIVAFAIWGWFDVRNRAAVDPDHRSVHKTDLTVYTEAGAAFFDGRDPYAVSNPRGWSYLYPPLFAMLVAPLHALDTQNQATVWFALSLLMAWGCYRELVRIARRLLPSEPGDGVFGPIPTWLGVAAVSTAMLPALNCLQRGQVGVAKLYFLLLGFRMLVESRAALGALAAGCVLAFPIALKITPAVPVAVTLCQQLVSACYRQARAAWARAGALWLGTAAGLAVCLLFLPAALVGWNANLHHLGTWFTDVALMAESTTQSDFAGDSTSVRNQSLTNATHRLGNWAHYYFAGGPHDDGPAQLRLGGQGLLMDAPLVAGLLWVVRTLAGGLVLLVGFRMARTQDQLGQAAAFGLASAATLVTFSIARGHYYVMLLPAVTFVSLWLLRNGRNNWAVGLAIVPVVLVIGHYVDVNVSGRIGLLGLGTTLWYFTAGFVLLRTAGRTACALSEASPASTPAQAVAEQPIAA